MSQLAVLPLYRLTDSNGVLIPNGRLYTFETGTLDPAATYTTSALSVSHGDYVQANAAGLLPALYFDPAVTYRCQVRAAPYASAVSGMDFDPVTTLDAGSLSFLQLGSGASSQTLQSYLEGLYLTPEAFGALGNGTADDTSAFTALFTAAQANALPIRLKQGASYGLGEAGWDGISLTLSRDLVIDGNGATFKILAIPDQARFFGFGTSVFHIDATTNNYAFRVENLNYDGGGYRAVAFEVRRGKVYARNCHFTNGGMGNSGFGDAAIAFHSPGCVRVWIRDCSCDQFGYFHFAGPTNAGQHTNNLTIENCIVTRCYREDASWRGAPIHGVAKNFRYAGNQLSGGLSGIAMPALASTSAICENGVIEGNHIEDQTGQGVQTDVFGATKNKNVRIVGNRVKSTGVAGAAYLLIHCSGHELIGNESEACEIGAFIDDADNFICSDNAFDAAGAATKIAGISLTCQLAATSEGILANNKLKDFAANIALGGAGYLVSGVDVLGNRTKGGARGLYIQQGSAGVSAIWIDGNDFNGGHGTKDIENGATNGITGVEFGDNKFATSTAVWFTKAYDAGSLATNASTAIQTVTVTGAVLGDHAFFVNASVDLAGARVTCWISAADTLSFYVTNDAGTNPLDLASATYRFGVRKAGT